VFYNDFTIDSLEIWCVKEKPKLDDEEKEMIGI